jgi:hypothetical protein
LKSICCENNRCYSYELIRHVWTDMLLRSNTWNAERQFSSEYRSVSQLVVHKSLFICRLESAGGLFLLLNTLVSVRTSRLCFIATLQSLFHKYTLCLRFAYRQKIYFFKSFPFNFVSYFCM